MKFFRNLKNRRTIEKALALGAEKEAQKDLEAAFEQYHRAAELGNPEAMIHIAKLYLSGEFRPVEASNLMDLILQGIPVFSWNMAAQKVPDYKSALEWFCKADDLGNAIACCMAGSMLCEGKGCKEDKPAGLRYLETAAAAGITEARNAICIYREHSPKFFAQEQYETLLKQFSEAAATGRDEAYTLYDELKCGHPQLLARLGYAITTAKNVRRPGFEPFQYSSTPSGIPLIPACAKRGAWKSFIRVDLNAFPSDDVLIAISSDIDLRYMLGFAHKLTPAGTAVYRSPEFGWLPEEKHPYLYRIDRNAALREEILTKLAGEFCLIDEEFRPDNAAFLTEHGEKEYSVEIAAIYDGKVDILYRYTIGGSDHVEHYFQPELISMDSEVGDFPKESDYYSCFFPSWSD